MTEFSTLHTAIIVAFFFSGMMAAVASIRGEYSEPLRTLAGILTLVSWGVSYDMVTDLMIGFGVDRHDADLFSLIYGLPLPLMGFGLMWLAVRLTEEVLRKSCSLGRCVAATAAFHGVLLLIFGMVAVQDVFTSIYFDFGYSMSRMMVLQHLAAVVVVMTLGYAVVVWRRQRRWSQPV